MSRHSRNSTKNIQSTLVVNKRVSVVVIIISVVITMFLSISLSSAKHYFAFQSARNIRPSWIKTPSTTKLWVSTPPTSPSSSASAYAESDFESDPNLLESGYKRPTVQWYPGHIAKAERQLSETLKAVDVVVEVRDARACKATSHPRVGEWCAGRPRIVVLTHVDHIPRPAIAAWKRSYEVFGAEKWDDAPVNLQVVNQANQAKAHRFQYTDNTSKRQRQMRQREQKNNSVVSPVEHVMFVDAKQGQGIHALHRAIFKAGSHVQERRDRRGLKQRPLRVGIIGYPNVGKSALINKILGRKRARTANTPGVTRSLQWIRVRTDDAKSSATSTKEFKKEFELLDSPGIIPAKMVDQSDAILLAACNCIGDAAYDNQAVAAYLIEWVQGICKLKKDSIYAPQFLEKCKQRFKVDPMEINNQTGELKFTGEDLLFQIADATCQGNPEDASRKILQDFRTSRLGPICLQLAPEKEDDDGHVTVLHGNYKDSQGRSKYQQEIERLQQEEIQERARTAMEAAKKRGLELPPIVVAKQDSDEEIAKDEIGKGLFDGW